MPGSHRFLGPSLLAGIRDLKLIARTVVEGFLAGQHLDLRSGAGVEFSQYRPYQPGDDPRRVDWRAYGRSDRYVVRESEIERDVTVRILLDVSASMAHEDTSPGKTSPHAAVSKLDYGRFLVAALAYLADRQGDQLAFHAISDQGDPAMPLPRRRRLDHLFRRLESTRAVGRWPRWQALRQGLPRSRGREIVVVISDLFDDDPETSDVDGIGAALAAFRALGHDVLVFQLMGRDELEFTFDGDLLFEDLETGETVRGNASDLRAKYLERLDGELSRWRRRLLEIGAHHQLVALDQPLDQALREFLLQHREAEKLRREVREISTASVSTETLSADTVKGTPRRTSPASPGPRR